MNRRLISFIPRAAMTLLVMLLTTFSARADAPSHKIVVIADPHVMGDGLQDGGSAWQTYLAGSRKLIDYSKSLFDQAVTDISGMAEKPSLVLIVGDLTKDGEQASHDYVKGKLDELKTAGIPTLVIPGNHDLGTSDAKIYSGDATSAATTIETAAAFATQYDDYGYGAGSERLDNTLTYACEPITDLVVIGIDSGTDGVLSDATLDWVCTKATAARAAGKQVVAMMHHPLIPHITGGDTFVETVSVANSTTVRNRLADAGITTVFTGHFHTSDIAKDWNADKSKTIYDINTGSLCSYPCDYRVVTLNNTMTQMSIATSTATGDATITADAAKTRLTNSMTAIAMPKIKAKAMEILGNEALATAAANMMAPKLANAYVYHAEGNENSNDDAQTLLTELNSLLSSYPAYQTMVNSMLQDKSNYGTDREDQTNDRTLDVSMPLTWEGSGTEGEPYLIKSTIQLNLLAANVNNGTSYSSTFFKLANDITYSYAGLGATESNYTAIGNYIGSTERNFSGTFDGGGHTVSGIRIYKSGNDDANSYQGLFGYVKDGTVKNVTLADTHITGYRNLGGIVGYNKGTIDQCTSLATVTVSSNGINMSAYGGGIVGDNGSIVSNCTSAATITIGDNANQRRYFGGIAGVNSGGSISNCTSSATITVGNNVSSCQNIGGIAGENTGSGHISNCISSVTITVGSSPTSCSYYGGIVGSNQSADLTCNLAVNVTISGLDLVSNYLGAILGSESNNLANNYYSSCTVGGQTSHIGRQSLDIPDNDGAVPATILSDEVNSLPALTEGTKVAFRRTFTGGKASTVVFPFDYTPGAEGNYYAFSGVNYDSEKGKWIAIMTTAVTPLAANTPYLFMPAGVDGIVPVLFHGSVAASTVAGSTTSGDWEFKGVYEKKTWAAADCGYDYGFAATNGKATDGVTDITAGDFVMFAEGAWLPPMRCYLTFADSGNPWTAGARSLDAAVSLPQSISVVLRDIEGDVTAIGNLDTKTGRLSFDSDVWYDLSGRPRSGKPTAKGVFIHNGRKEVIR